jgi:hypothetical protein
MPANQFQQWMVPIPPLASHKKFLVLGLLMLLAAGCLATLLFT